MTQASGAGGGDGTGSSGGAPRPDAARAETYLRLLAETELRRALAAPRIDPPQDRIPPAVADWIGSAAGAAGNAAGAVAALAQLAARPLQPAAARADQVAGPWAAGAAGVLAPPARRAGQTVAGVAGQARRAARRLRGRRSGPSLQHRAPPRDSIERVQAAADVLVAAGTLDEGLAQSVADGLERALVLRHRTEEDFFSPRMRIRRAQRSRPARSPVPAGPIRAAGVGARVSVEAEGCRGEMYLVALVLAPDHAGLTTVTWLAGPPGERQARHDRMGHRDPFFELIHSVRGQAADDLGGTYRVYSGSGGGSSDGPWEGWLLLSPVPAAGISWLELSLVPAAATVRIAVPATAGGSQPAGPPGPPAPVARRAERIIDAASESLLEHRGPGESLQEHPDPGASWRMRATADMIADLRAAGALVPGSPALARLATLTRRLGLHIPGELPAAGVAGPAGEAGDAGLPEAWRSVLEHGDSSDGPSGLAPVAAVLPGLDGARCVLAGLRSEAASATLQVLAWGWPARTTQRMLGESAWQEFCWQARDDAGRWHVGHYSGGASSDDGPAEVTITLTPPIHPAATALEVILSGLTGQVSVTVPLDWMAAP